MHIYISILNFKFYLIIINKRIYSMFYIFDINNINVFVTCEVYVLEPVHTQVDTSNIVHLNL